MKCLKTWHLYSSYKYIPNIYYFHNKFSQGCIHLLTIRCRFYLFIYAFTTSLAHFIMLHLWTNLMTAISRQPYIVINRLNRRGLKCSELLKRNMLKMVSVSVCPSDRQVSVRCEDGALFYDGERFSKGSSVVLEVNDNSPAQSVEHKTQGRICCRFGFVCKNISIEMVSLFSCVFLLGS